MRASRRTAMILLVVLGALTALLAIVGPRGELGARAAENTFYVTTSLDGGPGSLRSAVFAVDRAQGAARIVVRVPHLELSAPLPPLANPDGFELLAADDTPRVEIVAADWGDAPAIDVAAGPGRIRGVTLRHAPAEAIRVRGNRIWLENVEILDSGTGVHIAEGVEGFVLEGSRLIGNETGIRLESPGSGTLIESSRFERNGTGLFAVAGAGEPNDSSGTRLVVRGNRFIEDERALVVVGLPALIERNEFVRIGATAIHVAGGASRVSSNSVRDGRHTGILLEGSVGSSLIDNEVARNAAVGIHLRSARNSSAHSNRLYGNGYGITTMYDSGSRPNLIADNLLVGQLHDGIVVIGGAPILRSNRVLDSGAAGILLVDVGGEGESVSEASPLLTENSLAGNRPDGPVREVARDEVRR